jgi:hypothetical protein
LRRQPSLRSQLNQIRLWVRQGRTDAWIAHKLDVSIEQLERFKRDHDLDGEGAAPGRPADPLSVPPPDLDIYEAEAEAEAEEELDEVVAEELDALVEPPEAEEAPARRAPRRSRSRARDDDRPARSAERDEPDDRDEDGPPARRRRRGRRGGRRRRRPSSYEATFDHGEEGYGLWLDPAVVDNPVYAEHWADQRAVVVTFDRDSITIRRADGGPAEPEDDADEAEGSEE